MMQTLRRIFLLALLSVVGLSASWAQVNDPFSTPVTFSYLTIDEGLSSNTVRALLQDRMGFLWIGTSRGLNRFDGHRVVPAGKTRSLSVTSLVECGDTLWMGTDNGLFCYSQSTEQVRKFAFEGRQPLPESPNVSALLLDRRGLLWVATMGQGIFCIQPRQGTWRAVPTPDDAKSYGCLYENSMGMVWASGNWENNNLIRYDSRTARFEAFPLHFEETEGYVRRGDGSVPSLGGIALTEDSDGWMWLGAWDGSLIRFDEADGRASLMFTPSECGTQHVHSLMELTRGTLLVGSDRGLTLVDVKRRKVRQHTRGGSLSDNFVYPLMRDREGGTWIGTYYGGVNYTHPVSGNFTSYTHSPHGNSVSGNVVNHFCEDRQHRLWIASDDGGLCYYDPADGRFTSVRLSASGEEHNVHALCVDGDRLYVGTYAQGIDIVNLTTMAVENVPSFQNEQGNPFDASSFAIFCDRQHRLWVGTFGSVALFHPDTRTFSQVKEVGGLVNDFWEDASGRLWVATEGNGLFARGKDGKWQHYLDAQASSDGVPLSVNSLFGDGSGTLWAGTDAGLFRYDADQDRFAKTDLLASSLCVYGITAVEGHLWLTTSAGILCYSLTDEQVTQAYKGGGNIASVDFLPDAIFRGYDGRVYLGTSNGFIVFHPQTMHHNEVQPQVVFTGVDVFNRPVPVGSDILPQRLASLGELRLSYRENVFRIHFSAMSYLQPSDILYSYWLEGFDEEWVDAGNQQSVTYTNLSPGTYTLHVRAVTNDGVQSPDATLRIVIAPPFYWNTPAKILYLLLIAAVLFFYVRHLLRKKERRHVAEMQELNIQKEQEIQEINVQKEQEIQELNVQKEQEVHDARIKFMTITDKDQEFLDKMEVIIEQNFSNSDLSVDYLASELGVSRSGLFSKIKALADVTPNEMIQVIRLKHAASLLLTGNYRVNEVCYMVGFSSPSYFAKCFQKQYGTTPARYK